MVTRLAVKAAQNPAPRTSDARLFHTRFHIRDEITKLLCIVNFDCPSSARASGAMLWCCGLTFSHPAIHVPVSGIPRATVRRS